MMMTSYKRILSHFMFLNRENRSAQSSQASDECIESVLSTFEIRIVSAPVKLFWFPQASWERQDGAVLVRKRSNHDRTREPDSHKGTCWKGINWPKTTCTLLMNLMLHHE
jgi:hypothetical protein